MSKPKLIGVTSETITTRSEAQCGKCGALNPLHGDGIEYVCKLPGCDAVVKSYEEDGDTFRVVWEWSPRTMRCTHCGQELLATVQEFAVIKYVCINLDCVCCEK